MKFQIRNVRKFIAKFVGIILRNWGGQSIWGLGSIVRMKRESKKLRRNNVENVDAGECLNCTGEKMLHAIFAWGIGKAGLEKILRKLGSWIRTTGINIRRRKRCIIRNTVRGKLNAKCMSVRLGNVIGQDIWWVGSICWGAVVEELVVMGGWGRMRWRVSMSYSLLIYIYTHNIATPLQLATGSNKVHPGVQKVWVALLPSRSCQTAPWQWTSGRCHRTFELRYCWFSTIFGCFQKFSGTPKSSILIGFSIINHPFWSTVIVGNTHFLKCHQLTWLDLDD